MGTLKNILMEEIKKISEPLHVSIVELSVKKGKNGLHILVVIYKEGGVTIVDCEKVSRLFNNRLTILKPIEEGNYNLQVSSPGIYRVLKDKSEYNLFKSRPVKVILKKQFSGMYKSGVLKGILEGIKHDIATIDVEGERLDIPLERISKTKLNG